MTWTDVVLIALAAGLGLTVLNLGARPWDKISRRRDTLDLSGHWWRS